MDMDATLRGYPLSEDSIRAAFTHISTILVDDGVTFELGNIAPIREEDEYGGYRASLTARFETIHTPLKIDITTGDIITPGAIRYAFHSSFEAKVIDVWAYTVETILAEKIETILRRSVLNTRPRDFYDVYIIVKTQQQSIDKDILSTALKATCEKSMSQEALRDKERILITIRSDPTMRQRWDRYCNEYDYAKDIKFDEVIGILIDTVSF